MNILKIFGTGCYEVGPGASGVGGFEGSGGSGRVCYQQLVPHPHPLYRKKFSSDFYVSHGPHWAAQEGGSGPLDPPPGQLRRCPGSVKFRRM